MNTNEDMEARNKYSAPEEIRAHSCSFAADILFEKGPPMARSSTLSVNPISRPSQRRSVPHFSYSTVTYPNQERGSNDAIQIVHSFSPEGLGYYSGGSGGILDKLKDPTLREKAKAQLDANPEFAKFVEGGAFPLKMSRIENGQSRVVMEVTRIERKSLDDSLFTVPAGYQKEIP
jgi:hypothetical protein